MTHRNAFVTTLCGGDGYVKGAEALGRSLKRTRTAAAWVVMVTDDVSATARADLAALGWEVRAVAPITNPRPSEERLFARFGGTYTKLRAWELTEFDRVVLLDADTLVLRNVDELFERPAFAAAPDFLLPDRFNSGVMVLEPSIDTFRRMMAKLGTLESYDGGDQGFLNTFFHDWYAMPAAHRLPCGYNLHQFIYQFMHGHPSLRATLEHDARIVHYTVQKPWRSRLTLVGGSELWWNTYFTALGTEPEWQKRLHEAEDWTFEHLVQAVTA